MNLSERLSLTLNSFIFGSLSNGLYGYSERSIYMKYNRFLVIPLSEKYKSFVPHFALNSCSDIYSNNITSLVSSLHFPPPAISEIKTINKLFELAGSCWYCNLGKVMSVVFKDTTYYIGSGMIFDKDFHLLVTAGHNVWPDNENKLHIDRTHYICKIDYKVYNKEDTVSKFIRSKLIPYAASHCHSTIEINDLSPMVVSAVPTEDICKNPWDIIRQNIKQ